MSRIKECFTSRFHGGYIVEADYSQLEVICLAFLSGDKQLRSDILEGIDLHCASAATLIGKSYRTVVEGYLLGDPYITKQRKIAKGFSFQLQYGSGAQGMADQLGVDVKLAKEFIKNYYARYPGVKVYQDHVIETVKKSRKPSTRRTDSGKPAGVGHYTSLTGRRYVFHEYDAPEWMQEKGVMTSFSPTQMKNYPTQGFATGDIVPLIAGKVYETLASRPLHSDYALLINTVHDSLMLDVHPDYLKVTCDILKNIMEDAPRYIKEIWGIDFDLPLPVGISYGPSWADQTELTFK